MRSFVMTRKEGTVCAEQARAVDAGCGRRRGCRHVPCARTREEKTVMRERAEALRERARFFFAWSEKSKTKPGRRGINVRGINVRENR